MQEETPTPTPAPQPSPGPADAAGPGLVVSWGGDLNLADVLAAMALRERRRAGLDIPGWDEPDWSDPATVAGEPAGQPAAGQIPAGDELAHGQWGGDVLAGGAVGGDGLAGDMLAGDVLGEEAVEAALSGAGHVAGLADLAGYARLSPGPGLAGWLASAPAGGLDDAGLVGSIGGWRRLTSWAQAQELSAVAELARRRGVAGAGGPEGGLDGLGGGPDAGGGLFDPREAEFVPNEIALALTLTQASAQWWMDLAVSLARRLPATLAALRAGTIDLARAKLVDQHTAVLDDGLARKVEDRVLPKAGKQTTGQLRAALQRAVISADPAAAERRREEAEECARVELSGEETGTASLGGRFLPVAHAAAAWARISAMAKAMQSAGAGGGIDLLRAQVFVGMLLGTLPLIPPPDDGPGDDPAGPGAGDDPEAGDDPGGDDPGGDGNPAGGAAGRGCGSGSGHTGGPGSDGRGAGRGGGPGAGRGPGSGMPAGRPGAGRGAACGGGHRGGPGEGCGDGRGGGRAGPSRDRGSTAGDSRDGPADRARGHPDQAGGPAGRGGGLPDPGGGGRGGGSPDPGDGGPGGRDGGSPDPGGGRDGGSPRPGGGPGGRDAGCPGSGDGGGGRSGWEGRPAPREQDAPPVDDERDEVTPGELGAWGGGQEHQGFSRPPPAWPRIPGPGEASAPGCAPGWPGGIAPRTAGTAAGGTATGGTATGGTAGNSDGGGAAGEGTAGGRARGAAWKAALTVPWRTLAGLCEEPGLLGRIGPVTAHAARDLAAAALTDPACLWKIIITGPSGQVVAVTRIRRRRAGTPGGPETPGAPGLIGQVTLTIPATLALAEPAAWPPPGTPGAAMLAAAGLTAAEPSDGRLGRMLAAALLAARRAAERAAGTPAGSGPCAHQGAVAGYRVPGSLRDFIDARDQGCRNPVCRQPAAKCDVDHTVPWDKGGLTCSCDLSDACRRHHRMKQLRRWLLRQPRPGHLIWTTPARLTYTSTPPPHPA